MSTYYSLHYHLIFATKHRKPWIKDEWITRLHAYLGGTIRKFDGKALKVGGVSDHVHVLMGLKTTHCIADFVRELKKSATGWVHEEIQCEPFCWQEGYSIFTVSPNACDQVANYIANQAEHHRQRSFQDELGELLKLAGVDYDPRYLE